MNNLVILCCSFCLVLATACYYDKEELLYADDTCDPTGVSFAADIQPILSNSCAVVGCHVQGGGAPGLYENYDQTQASVNSGRFAQRVTVSRDMPPSGPLSDCQIEHINAWIAAGAPDN